jgi:membrane-bound inhibitor of C-type lysozyme
MATGQTLGNYSTGNGSISGTLYQDSSYLYWINGSGQLMKLAK